MFKVRRASASGGYEYLIEASTRYDSKYRWAKRPARAFRHKKTAVKLARKYRGHVAAV